MVKVVCIIVQMITFRSSGPLWSTLYLKPKSKLVTVGRAKKTKKYALKIISHQFVLFNGVWINEKVGDSRKGKENKGRARSAQRTFQGIRGALCDQLMTYLPLPPSSTYWSSPYVPRTGRGFYIRFLHTQVNLVGYLL